MSVQSSNQLGGLAGVAGGFAPLDSGILVPRAYLPQIAGLLHNLTAVVAPTANDDSGDGYGVGSFWVDTTGPLNWAWICVDASVGAAVWKLITQGPTLTLGPYFFNDLAGTGNNDATPMFFNTATAVSRASVGFRSPNGVNGEIVGASIVADGARTAGTATLKVLVGGSQNDFASDAVQLNAINTDRVTIAVAPGSGLSVSGSSTIQPRIVTSGWTPTTSNVAVLIYLALGPQ